MADKRVKATFQTEARFATIGRKKYPVLLTIYRNGDNYQEDVSDTAEFSRAFVQEFGACLQDRKQAILVRTGPHGGGEWITQSLYEIRTSSVSNFIQCTLGERLAWVD